MKYLIKRFPDDVPTPRLVSLEGITPADPEGPLDFAIDLLDAAGNAILHFNARPSRRRVVLNSRLDGEWGEEVLLKRYPFSTRPGRPFALTLEVLDECVRIALDGHELCDFPRRSRALPAELRASLPLWDRDGRPQAQVGEGAPAAVPGGLGDTLVATYPQGLDGAVSLELSGEHPWTLQRDGQRELEFKPFAVNWVDADGNVVFHFGPRPEQQAVEVNSYVLGEWGEEQLIPRYPFRLEPDIAFRLRFDVDSEGFRVFVDDETFCIFPHRAPRGLVREVRSTTFLWRLEPAVRSRLRRARSGRRAFVPEISAPPGTRRTAAEQWLSSDEALEAAEPLESFRFFAIVGTWLEEDVIEATVANALRQGCERVYLVDNASPDETVERALAAGATLARTFSQQHYDEVERIRQMQAVADDVSRADGADHVWWLWLDADEFHHGPGGLDLQSYLRSLDRRYRVVGARFFNHFPDGEPAYREGKHPLDFQPLCYEVPFPYCELGHLKHPLQRWDRAGPPISSGTGFHRVVASTSLTEPKSAVFCHHFPFRAETATRRRFEALMDSAEAGRDRIARDPQHAHIRLRRRSLEGVYAQAWDRVAFFPPVATGFVPELRPWQEWVDAAESTVARWY